MREEEEFGHTTSAVGQFHLMINFCSSQELSLQPLYSPPVSLCVCECVCGHCNAFSLFETDPRPQAKACAGVCRQAFIFWANTRFPQLCVSLLHPTALFQCARSLPKVICFPFFDVYSFPIRHLNKWRHPPGGISKIIAFTVTRITV